VIFRALVRIFEFLVVLLLARLVLRSLGGLFAQSQKRQVTPPPAAGALAPEEMVRDSVCQTFIPRKNALVARVSGADQYFCSAACRDKALEAMGRAS
jgi:YHS domain-containing protein